MGDLAFVLTVSGVWLPLERWLYDKTIGILAFGDPTGEGYVRVVAIDDASLNKVGPWPWPRSILAEVLEHIAKAGARVIVLDVLLAEATPDDGSLAMAMDSPLFYLLLLEYTISRPGVVFPLVSFLIKDFSLMLFLAT